LDKLIQKVKRGIARLIDAYAEGLVEKSEFEPRLRNARNRLERLQADAKEQADHEAQELELRLLLGRLQEFADQVRDGLQKADWLKRREIIRAYHGDWPCDSLRLIGRGKALVPGRPPLQERQHHPHQVMGRRHQRDLRTLRVVTPHALEVRADRRRPPQACQVASATSWRTTTAGWVGI
jgi:hypothetical protein